jgi:HEPN domain-containing protein
MRKKLVKEWIYKGEEDFESARHLVKKAKKPVPDVVCFHCQQSIEKYLKAFLAQNNIEPPEIHDLQRLNNICLKVDKSFDQISEGLDVLNAYAVNFRYPGEGATVRESKKAFQIAAKIRKILKSKLKMNREQSY